MLNRPRDRPAPDKFDRLCLLLSVAAVFTSIIVPLAAIPGLPAQVPTRFSSGGGVTLSSKWALLAVPGINLAMFALLTLTLWLPPRFYNYAVPITQENALRQYRLASRLLQVMRVQCTWLLALLAMEITFGAQGNPTLGEWVIIAGLSAIMATVIWYLVQSIQAK